MTGRTLRNETSHEPDWRPLLNAIDRASHLDVLAESCWMAAEELAHPPRGANAKLEAEARWLRIKLEDLARECERAAIDITDKEG